MCVCVCVYNHACDIVCMHVPVCEHVCACWDKNFDEIILTTIMCSQNLFQFQSSCHV